MNKENTKASNSTLTDEQYKLSDFIEEFVEFRTCEDNSRFGCDNISNNLFRSYKNGKIYFKSIKIRCPNCKSRNVSLNATKERELIFLIIGNQTCLVQQFKCKKCGIKISTDLSSIVYKNSNITYPVIKHVLHLYGIFTGSLRKIQKSLKIEHKIDISHQAIENIILFSDFDFEIEPWSLSGYYIFDALWVKKNSKWKYLVCLFDFKLNTIVGRSLLDSETSDAIEGFLKETLRNQKKTSITTDLKKEYIPAISKLGIKHKFCSFHAMQNINKRITKDISNNNYSEEEYNLILDYKDIFYEILTSTNLKEAENIKNNMIKKNNDLPKIISKILWDFIVPYFKNLTFHLLDENIESTSNKLENYFHQNFNKSTKKLYKTENGILRRFDLKRINLDEDNRIW